MKYDLYIHQSCFRKWNNVRYKRIPICERCYSQLNSTVQSPSSNWLEEDWVRSFVGSAKYFFLDFLSLSLSLHFTNWCTWMHNTHIYTWSRFEFSSYIGLGLTLLSLENHNTLLSSRKIIVSINPTSGITTTHLHHKTFLCVTDRNQFSLHFISTHPFVVAKKPALLNSNTRVVSYIYQI